MTWWQLPPPRTSRAWGDPVTHLLTYILVFLAGALTLHLWSIGEVLLDLHQQGTLGLNVRHWLSEPPLGQWLTKSTRFRRWRGW